MSVRLETLLQKKQLNPPVEKYCEFETKNGRFSVEGCLEYREVDDRRIDFDLAEIGIHRRIEREVRRDVELDIAARARSHLAIAMERIIRETRDPSSRATSRRERARSAVGCDVSVIPSSVPK